MFSWTCGTLNYIFFIFVDFSNKSVWPTWQGLPRLTSHHSGVEAPEAECQDFSFDSDALSLSYTWSNKKTLGIRDIGWDLVRPSIALLKSHPVVFSKPTDIQRTTERSVNSISNTVVNLKDWHDLIFWFWQILWFISDLQLFLKRKSSTMKRLLRIVEVAEQMVGTFTISSLPLIKPTRSSFSNTAIKFCCLTHTRIPPHTQNTFVKSSTEYNNLTPV